MPPSKVTANRRDRAESDGVRDDDYAVGAELRCFRVIAN